MLTMNRVGVCFGFLLLSHCGVSGDGSDSPMVSSFAAPLSSSAEPVTSASPPDSRPDAQAQAQAESRENDPPAVERASESTVYSPNCPAGMLEVKGNYCTALMHSCKKGRGINGTPSDLPDPYYCDEYKEGYAKCLGHEEPKHFCMDEFEFPNRKGAIPAVMVTWYEAKRQCEDQGKRICGDDEWTLACEGPERLPYTYGWKRNATACNIDKPWRKPDDGALSSKIPERIDAEVERLSQRLPSGAMPDCISPYGVRDLGGNVDEWAVNVTLGGKPYQSIFKGGHWCGGARNRCRPTTESHDETTAYYAEGFRCCANPSGPAPEPPSAQ